VSFAHQVVESSVKGRIATKDELSSQTSLVSHEDELSSFGIFFVSFKEGIHRHSDSSGQSFGATDSQRSTTTSATGVFYRNDDSQGVQRGSKCGAIQLEAQETQSHHTFVILFRFVNNKSNNSVVIVIVSTTLLMTLDEQKRQQGDGQSSLWCLASATTTIHFGIQHPTTRTLFHRVRVLLLIKQQQQ